VAWLLLKRKTLGVALTIIGGLIVAATVVLVALALASPM
jgi:hypothetical protein